MKPRATAAALGPFLALSALATALPAAGIGAWPPGLLTLSPGLVRPACSLDPAAAQAAPAGSPGDPKLSDKINLSGLLAGEGRWRRTVERPNAGTTTDLYLRAFEIGIEADIVDWVSATVVLNSEWIGDALNGGDAGIILDEAHIDIAVPRTPLYFVLGKRTQPFGLFETHFVTDPLVQDAYETQAVGLTAGIKVPRSTDLSVTVYKGRIQSDHLAQSGLFGTDASAFPQVAVNRVDSWILSGTSSPAGEAWTVFAALISEPGAGRRMTSFSAGSNLIIPGLTNLQLDAEYVRALRREDIPGLGRSFREAALSVTASYQSVTRKRAVMGGGNYRARKSHRLAHPAEVAVRFEAFDDGSRAAVLGSWSVKNRVSLGGRYTFFERGSVLAALDLEFRRQTLRISPAYEGSVGAYHEVTVRLGLDF
jgi:hypothetical protein